MRPALPLRLSDDVHPGQVFCAFHFPVSGVNARRHRDVMPEYKLTAVRPEHASVGGEATARETDQGFPDL
ncbi:MULTISPECIES: hypothetical protein [unclassified Nonomuraea]|uniref:hypothetical protein n=1 Tax=unclassified Nonomuraea TaxID=2593643 RepID=UPI0033CA331A